MKVNDGGGPSLSTATTNPSGSAWARPDSAGGTISPILATYHEANSVNIRGSPASPGKTR